MTDYFKNTGSTGQMMIRDQSNGWVEFWLRAGSSTFAYDLQWAYTANGSTTGWMKFRFESGGAWQKLGAVYISTSQTVTFKMGASGTSGLGGPTDFSQYLQRETIPAPPGIAGPHNMGSTSCDISFASNGDGGAAIDHYQVAWGTDAWNPQNYQTGGWWQNVGGLVPGTYYYFWGRAHNSQGYSGWSNRVEGRAKRVPTSPSTPWPTDITGTSMKMNFYANWDGDSPINWWDVGYGTDPNNAMWHAFGGGSPISIGGLSPGVTYYFWVRAQNSVGWGDWSGRAQVRTTPGAYVLSAGQYKPAIPYVRSGGVWRPALPFVKVNGNWKSTT